MPDPWVKKYCPVTTSDIIGQDLAIKRLKGFIVNFKSEKKRAIMLYGPSGCGKTCLTHMVAKELDLEVLELNASDFRNKEQIDSVLGSASKQMSLFFRGKVILVDEIDGLSGTKDRGGITALSILITETSFPIVLTLTNPWNHKFSPLRRKTEMLQLNDIDAKDIFHVLQKIASAEKIEYDEMALKGLARRSEGDLRSAINDLQTLTTDKKLSRDSLDELGERNRLESILNALVLIFKNSDANVARDALSNVEEDLDQVILWIDENLPLEYKDAGSLARAYEYLSKADVFRRRIKRWQHWRYLSYINDFITAGVAVSKKEKNKKFISYKPTSRILKLWKAKMKYQKRLAITEKIAEHIHCSTKEALQSSYPYIKSIFTNNKVMSCNIAEELDLNKEEVAWLRK